MKKQTEKQRIHNLERQVKRLQKQLSVALSKVGMLVADHNYRMEEELRYDPATRD